MSLEPTLPPDDDERLAAMLAALDDAIAEGKNPDLDGGGDAGLRHDLAYLCALRRALKPGPGSALTQPSPPPRPPAAPLPWDRLGRFELRLELGRGGCGIVYLAHDAVLQRDVALKVPRAEVALTPELSERFQREAQAAASLEHPNVVAVYEAGAVGPVCYIASAYCPGVTLAQWLKDNPEPIPFADAAGLLATLAGAVEHAHRRGVLHRDLKPSNVLLQAHGLQPVGLAGTIPKITDFGLAKFLLEGTKPGQTLSGAIVGTPNYMAPEQAAGKVRDLTPAADVWALGAILYELLTGRPPFKGETDLDTLRRAQTEEPLTPARLRPRLPRDLETICLKCLEKEPARRYPSAALLAEDLQRFLAGQPIRARPVGRLGRVQRWCRRNPALAAAWGLLAVSVIGAGALAVGYAFARLEAQSAESLRGALAEAQDQRARAGEASAQLALERGLALCQQGETGRGMQWLARSLALAPEEAAELRRAARANLAGWRGQVCALRAVLDHKAAVTHLALRPDGRVVASGDADGAVRLWDVATGRPLPSPAKQASEVEALAFSPDGRTLLTGSGQTVQLWQADTAEPRSAPHPVGGIAYSVAFSPDGATFAVGTGDRDNLWLCQTATGRPLGPPLGCECAVHALAFSRDGRFVVAGVGVRDVVVMDARTGRRQRVVQHHTDLVEALAVFPDGRGVVTASGDGTARRWDLTTGEPAVGVLRHRQTLTGVAVSPDGGAVATASEDGTARVWQADSGEPRTPPLTHQGPVRQVAFSPDGRAVATASHDGTARLWDAATGRPVSPALPHRDQVLRLAFSPVGPTLIAASADGTVRFWDARVRPAGIVLRHDGPVSAAAFSRDGRTVATGSWDQTARLWDAVTGAGRGPAHRYPGRVLAVALSPDGQTVGMGGTRGGRLWQPATGRTSDLTLTYPCAAFCVAFRPDGKTFVTGASDRQVRLWRADTGERFGPAWPHRHAVRSLAFSRDGRLLASGDRGGGVRLTDMDTGRSLGPLPLHTDAVYALSFDPSGRWLATGSHDKTARLWDAEGRPVGPPLPHDGRVLALAIHPDGGTLATGCADAAGRLWRADTGGAVGRRMPHQGAVQAVTFSPDGRVVATGGADGAVHLWDAATTKPFGMPLTHDGPVEKVRFSPDGGTILTASQDHTARLWRLPPPVEGTAERLQLWAEVLTGLELDAEGVFGVLDAPSWGAKRRRLAGQAGPALP